MSKLFELFAVRFHVDSRRTINRQWNEIPFDNEYYYVLTEYLKINNYLTLKFLFVINAYKGRLATTQSDFGVLLILLLVHS